MKKIKIAQLGAGHDHATAAITTLKLQSDLYDLVGYAAVDGDEPVYDNNQWAYENVKKMTVDEILHYPGLDAVCIETEDRRLTEFAIKAAEKGLHIQMDKPGSESDADFDRLIDLVKEKNLVFHMGYMYRYNPAIVISGNVNDRVTLVAKGKITDISVNEETGCTVTQDLGDGYQAVYGQLKDLNFEEGAMTRERNCQIGGHKA